MTRREQGIAALQAMSDEEYEDAASEDDFDDDAPDDDAADADRADDFDGGDGAVAAETAAEFAAAHARIAELEAKDRRRDAEVFVDAAIKDGLALPAERARLVARHAEFAFIEQTAPASFASGRRLTLVADFEADIRGRKAHRWGANLIPADFSGRTLDNGGDGPESDQEYAKRLVARYNGHNRKPGRAG